MMTPTKMKLRVRKKDGGGRSSRRLLAEASPDSKCPICLDRFNNVASLDRCLHRFCFRCIHEWSKNKAECPLCKQPFRSIFHSVKAENDFKEFVLAPVENGAVVSLADQMDIGPASGRVRRPRMSRGGERRSRRHQSATPSASSPDVRLEGLTQGVPGAADQERGVHRMMLRLTERRRSRVEERSLRHLRDQDVVAFRRALYRTGVRVRGAGWDGGRQRDVSAGHLRRNPACLRRLLPWLQRELTVLYGSHGSLVSIVQHIIMSRITHYDMDDAAIRDELRPFLLARTDHFLHEMISFARSTLSLEAYDQQAVYECPAPSYEEDSSSNSSIIAISEDEDSEEVHITEDITQERVPPVPVATGGENSLSQSAWDDETPGPSYSTLLPSPSQSQAEEEPVVDVVHADEVGGASGAAGQLADEEDECMIVGYVKPMAERTPELVQLSSDSSEEDQEAVAAETLAAAVPKAEASSSQAQTPSTPMSHPRPLSPSSCPYQSASCSPSLHVGRLSPQHAQVHQSHSVERDAGRHSCPRTEKEAQRHGVRDRSRSDSDSSVLSGHSEHHRSHKRSGSRCQERLSHRKSRKWSRHSSVRSPTVVTDSSESARSPAWEPPQSRDRSCLRRSDNEPERARSTSARERSSQSSVYWDSPGRGSERKKARKRRREKERERSQSPPRNSNSNDRSRDSRRRNARLRTGSRSSRSGSSSSSSSSSSTSSSSSVDSLQGQPCPEKPAGKRKYKTRHLERAAQRQSKQKSSRDRERREARSSPAKRHRGAERERSRSPSVEIVFERRPSETASHTHRWRRKRHKRRSRREQNSPTIITIESDSDANDYQGTTVITRTADSRQHLPEAANSSNPHVLKAAVCQTDDQCSEAEAANSRTAEDQHHGTEGSYRTTEDQKHGANVSHRTTEDQHSVHKVSSSTTDDLHRVPNAADHEHLVTEENSGNSPVSEVTDYACGPEVDVPDRPVACQENSVSAVDRSDAVPETLPREVDASLSVGDVLLGPSVDAYSPVTPPEHFLDSPDCALNLEHCVVDVVDRDSFDQSQCSKQPASADNQEVSAAAPPSDTRLLESILQELEDILPERGRGESGREDAVADREGDHLEDREGACRDQSDAEKERHTESTITTSDSRGGAESSSAV